MRCSGAPLDLANRWAEGLDIAANAAFCGAKYIQGRRNPVDKREALVGIHAVSRRLAGWGGAWNCCGMSGRLGRWEQGRTTGCCSALRHLATSRTALLCQDAEDGGADTQFCQPRDQRTVYVIVAVCCGRVAWRSSRKGRGPCRGPCCRAQGRADGSCGALRHATCRRTALACKLAENSISDAQLIQGWIQSAIHCIFTGPFGDSGGGCRTLGWV